MTTEQKLKQKIMRGVYLSYAWRKMKTFVSFKIIALFSLLFSLASLVSIRNVIQNGAHAEGASLYHFYTSAFLNTETSVQFLILGVLLMLGLIIADTIRNYRAVPLHAYR